MRSSHKRKCSGAALLIVIFTVFMVSSLLLNVLDTVTQHQALARNVRDYERALYLANAGVHHACVLLSADNSWRGSVTDGGYPGDGSYSATAADGVSGQVDISATGVAGEATRTVQATIEL